MLFCLDSDPPSLFGDDTDNDMDYDPGDENESSSESLSGEFICL